MTSLNDLFSIFDFNNKGNLDYPNKSNGQKKKKVRFLGDTNVSSDTNELEQVGLEQGKRFNKYQKKIAKHLEKELIFEQKEGFESYDKTYAGKLTKETEQVIKDTNLAPYQKGIDDLHKQYGKYLYDYEDGVEKLSGSTTNYFDRISPGNPYLGKNIVFSNGVTGYVTQQGVVKIYENGQVMENTAGKNGCPGNNQSITAGVPWNTEYNVEGTTIPTKPALISGTPMQQGQSCGNEGSNVFVNQLIKNPSATYEGVFADNTSSPLMTFIGGAPPVQQKNGTIQNGSFSEPQISANSYIYSPNPWTFVPGWVFNAVLINNSYAWGYSMPYPKGNQALCIQGLQWCVQGIFLNAGKFTISFYACGRPGYSGANKITVVYREISAPSQTNIQSFTPPISGWQQYSYSFQIPSAGNYYLGFQGTIDNGDNSTAIQGVTLQPGAGVQQPSGSYSYEECQEEAVNQGYQYFALQNVNTSTSNGYCAVSNDYPTITKLGPSMIPNGMTAVWSSNTASSGTTASLTNAGTLTVFNSGGQPVFSSPNTDAQPNNYLGCYADYGYYGTGNTRSMNLINGGSQQYNVQQCQQIAQQQGAAYFGLQNSTSGTNAQCGLSNNFAQLMYRNDSVGSNKQNGFPLMNAFSNIFCLSANGGFVINKS
jgi:hypothetical protein